MAPPEKDRTQQKDINFLSEVGAAVWAGMLHASIETPIVIPIEASITQTQINGQNFFSNFKTLFQEGAMYRSLPMAWAAAGPKAAVHYSWLTLYLNAFVPSGSMRDATLSESVKVGLATGMSEVGFITPLNMVKFRMQRPEWGYTGTLDAIQTIARTEGVAAFWKGTLPSFCRNSVCMAGMLGGYRGVEDQLPEWVGSRRHLLAGMIGGLSGSLMSYPFEMWRAAQMHNRSFKDEMLSKGPKRLLAGWAPGATRLVITSGVMGELLPRMKAWSKQGSEAMNQQKAAA